MLLARRLACLIPVILAPVALVEIYNGTSLRAERIADIGVASAQRADALVAESDRLARSVRLTLFAASLDAGQAIASPGACRLLLRALSLGGADIRIRVLDANGVVRCARRMADIGMPQDEVPDIAEALRTGRAVSGPFESGPFDEGGSRRITVPWWGERGARGVVTAELDISAVANALMAARLPPGVDVLVLDKAGRIVPGRPATVPGLLPGFPGGSDPVRVVWIDGSQRIASARPLGGVHPGGPTVVVGISIKARTAALDAAFRRSLALLGLIWLVSTAVAIAMANTLIKRPIRILEHAVTRWRDGDHAARALLPGRTELTELGQAFDEMADAIAAGERERRANSEVLRRLVAAIPDAVFVKDPSGRTLLSNATFDQLVTAGMHAFDDDLIASVAERREIHVGEETLTGPDRVTRTFQVVYAPLFGDEGTLFAIAGIGRDLTEIRRAEEALRSAKDDAEAANRSKTRFLASASHDLRQPVQGALLFAEAAFARAGDGAAAGAAIARCVRALTDMSGLLDSLLDLSRLDAGLAPANIAEFPLQPLLEEVVAANSGAAAEKGLRLGADETLAVVRSDRVLLARMLNNLVTNAVRYTNEGEVHVTSDRHGKRLRVEVSDTGIGIPAASIETIFEEFHQLHNPERDRARGLGLGLSIVQRLSRLLGHEVLVVSEPGRGSTFSVDLEWVCDTPVVPAASASSPRALEPADARRHALLIDDDLSLLQGLGWIAEDLGLSVSLADDGSKAIASALARRPDVILADFRLREGERGTAVIDRIRGATGVPVPAVLLTGDSGDEVRQEAERVSALVIIKPARPMQIANAIRAQLAGARRSAPNVPHATGAIAGVPNVT